MSNTARRLHARLRRGGALVVLLVAGACATAPSDDGATAPSDDGAMAPSDDGAWREVRILERTREGESHFALPTALPGCRHLAMARVRIPEGVPGLPPELLDTIRKQAARRGGNTLVLLPGRRVVAGWLRGSVFSCPASP